jgi:hypothetical protein
LRVAVAPSFSRSTWGMDRLANSPSGCARRRWSPLLRWVSNAAALLHDAKSLQPVPPIDAARPRREGRRAQQFRHLGAC